jgi:hypothetical protein
MTHILPSQWPQLCEYERSWRIKSHWPKAQGIMWSLPPCINIFFWDAQPQGDPDVNWEMGQRLYDNSGTTWRYKQTTWESEGHEVTLDIWSHSLKRDRYWEYSIEAYLYAKSGRLMGLGEKSMPYATPHYRQYPPYLNSHEIIGRPVSYPYWSGGVYITPSRLKDMWPEEPRPLTYGTQSGSTVPEFSGDRG